MDYGTISLLTLYETIKAIHGDPTIPPPIPRRGTPEYRQYFDTASALIRNVPGDQAVYYWFSKEVSKPIEPIYVGESHKNRDGLRGRLADEFKQWYHVFWMAAFHSEKYERETIEMYSTSSVDYTKDIVNQSLKRGATHIVYCTGTVGEIDPLPTQNDLIQMFGNPRGNAKDIRTVPFPDTAIRPTSKTIFSKFQSCIANAVPYTI